MMKKFFIFIFLLIGFSNLYSENKIPTQTVRQRQDAFLEKITKRMPDKIFAKIVNKRKEFFEDLKKVLDSEKEDCLILADKKTPLKSDFKPKKTVLLKDIKNNAFKLDRDDIELSALVIDSLQKMSVAAKKEGALLIVSSGYRPFDYQQKLFEKYSKKYGSKNAEKFSAKAGTSQHQLGTAIDFDTITNAFANTKAGKWLFKNAGKYGWSLSYPRGLESVTGYEWESWHYRYIGVEACRFQKKWFDNIQQYTLEAIHLWKN